MRAKSGWVFVANLFLVTFARLCSCRGMGIDSTDHIRQDPNMVVDGYYVPVERESVCLCIKSSDIHVAQHRILQEGVLLPLKIISKVCCLHIIKDTTYSHNDIHTPVKSTSFVSLSKTGLIKKKKISG